MPDIDFGLAYDFIDPADGIPRQLRFTCNYAPAADPRPFDGTGQLLATVGDDHRADNGHTLAISRPDVAQADVERALAGWETWAKITDTEIDLAEISRRIGAAGPGPR